MIYNLIDEYSQIIEEWFYENHCSSNMDTYKKAKNKLIYVVKVSTNEITIFPNLHKFL